MSSDPGMLNINFNSLGDAQAELAAHHQAAKDAIDELKNKLASGLSLWSGDARSAYDEVQRDWDKAFAHMASVLQKAHAHLGNANEVYQNAERQNSSIWRAG